MFGLFIVVILVRIDNYVFVILCVMKISN